MGEKSCAGQSAKKGEDRIHASSPAAAQMVPGQQPAAPSLCRRSLPPIPWPQRWWAAAEPAPVK